MNLNDQVESYRSLIEKSRTKVEKSLKNFNNCEEKLKNPTKNIWDKEISDSIKDVLRSHPEFDKYKFFSEEDNGGVLELPTLMLDPIDGTREFFKNLPECAVSLSLIESWELSDKKGVHWIWNFRNNNELWSFDGDLTGVKIKKQTSSLCLVSRREFDEGAYKNFNGEIQVEPMGSIANKLLLLALGGCEYVYSNSPKNIWDICAGTFLLHQKGFSFYEGWNKIDIMNKKLFHPPLVWCHQDKVEDLKKFLSYNGIS